MLSRARLASNFAIDEFGENFEVVGIGYLGLVIFRLVAEGAAAKGHEGSGGPHVAFDSCCHKGFHKGSLFGDFHFAVAFADANDLAKLLEKLGL